MATEREEDSNAIYVNGLQQIIANIGPLLKLSWSASAAEEILLNLETTDENFHKYDLVRYIKNRIEKEIGPLVDNLVEKEKPEMQDHRVFPMLNETVVSSQEYNRLSQTILNSVRSASEKILQTIYDNQDYPLSPVTETPTRISHNWASSNDIESMLSSSFEGDLMFASLERYEKIASDLKSTNSREVRQDAFNCLYQIPQADIVSSENWHVIKDQITLALGDCDDVIAEKSLRFHAKMFASGTPYMSKEVFFSLCQSLTMSFQTKSFTEVDLNDNITARLLNQLRLLNQFQHYLPVYWIRYPEKVVQELVKCTMDLLTINAPNPIDEATNVEISPIYFLALIDVKATWFQKWIHGHHSRVSLIKRIGQEHGFTSLMCKSIVDFHAYCQTLAGKCYQNLIIPEQIEERAVYPTSYLKYTLFIHATNIIKDLLLHKMGREIFPIHLPNKKLLDLKHLFVILIEIMQMNNTSVSAMFTDLRVVHPGLLVSCFLKTIAKSSSGAASECLYDDHVTNALLKPLHEFMVSTTTVPSNKLIEFEIILTLTADILSSLAVLKLGREHLLYGSSYGKRILHAASPAFVISDFTKRSLIGNSNWKPLLGIVNAYLFICRQLFASGEGLYSLQQFDFSKCICTALEKIKKENRKKGLLNVEKEKCFALRGKNLPETRSIAKDIHFVSDSPPHSVEVKKQLDSPFQTTKYMLDNYHSLCHKGCLELSHEIGGRYDFDGLPVCKSSKDFRGIKLMFSSLLSLEEDAIFHEMALLDSLLSFSMTPKGVLFIQQSGYLPDCVKYLYTRHIHGFQVSKIDKYGYGVMLSQLSSIGPGVLALENNGFIKDLLEDIWIFLEGGSNDYNTTILPVYKEDMKEKHCQKLFSSLVNILPSFPSMSKLICKYPTMASTPDTSTDGPLTSANAPPTPSHLQDFLNQVVLLDSNRKIKLLYHFDFTHLFGLRVLSCMVCCLDTLLLLETRYRYQEILLKLQSDFQPEDGVFMIDACSVERNQILVRSYVIGGFSERFIPPRELSKDPEEPYKWMLFSTYPVPKEYTLFSLNRPRISSGNEDFIRFLCNSQNVNDISKWLMDLRKTFVNYYTSGHALSINRSSIKYILTNVCKSLVQIESNVRFSAPDGTETDASLRSMELTEIETTGIELVLRYGVALGLLQSTTDAREGLKFIYRRCHCNFRSQQRTVKSDLQSSYGGFDWFLGTIFLIFEGNVEETWMFLKCFLTLSHSVYLWPTRHHMSNEVLINFTKIGIHPLFFSTCHNIQLILESELPQVFSAVRMSGYTSSQICQLWLRQCFWNYLDWDEICMYISTCLIMGIDYQVYFVVSILKHLEKDILCHSHRKDVVIFLKEEPIRYFSTTKYLKSMLNLEEQYREIVLGDMLQTLNGRCKEDLPDVADSYF